MEIKYVEDIRYVIAPGKHAKPAMQKRMAGSDTWEDVEIVEIPFEEPSPLSVSAENSMLKKLLSDMLPEIEARCDWPREAWFPPEGKDIVLNTLKRNRYFVKRIKELLGENDSEN